jgi:phosphatidylserine decarboxylase
MRIASDALPFALPPALLAVTALAWGLLLPGVLLAALAAAITAFFRDPERSSDAPSGHVLSPADGRVLAAGPEDDGRVRVTIFLSLFNVHVARSPVAGRLVRAERIDGGYAAAYRDEAAQNARVHMEVETPAGPVEFALMAGLVARRVLPWVSAPARLERGQRVAIIRFGSRSEVLLPRGFEAVVAEGDTVRAGVTVIARPVREDQ